MLRANITDCYSYARDLVGKKAKGILWRELSLLWISVRGYIYLSSDYLYKIVLGRLFRARTPRDENLNMPGLSWKGW